MNSQSLGFPIYNIINRIIRTQYKFIAIPRERVDQNLWVCVMHTFRTFSVEEWQSNFLSSVGEIVGSLLYIRRTISWHEQESQFRAKSISTNRLYNFKYVTVSERQAPAVALQLGDQ